MDLIKRKSLKRLAGVVVAGTGFSLAKNTLATNQYNLELNNSDVEASLSSLQVFTRISASTNDVEIVISNTGENTACITQMTPSQTSTARGVFEFSQLMDDGDLVLAAGQSVSVPMTKHPAKIGTPVSVAKQASSLTNSLRSSFSAITDNAAFARVNVAGNIKLA